MNPPLQLTQSPVANAAMLIRRPPLEVFEAFVDPEITRRFWFTRGSGRLAPGKTITWTWEMYNFSVEVHVREVQPPNRILVEWPYNGFPTIIEWTFTPHEGHSYVSVTNSGFQGDGDKVVRDALDSRSGFTWVLAGLKAWLEHGIELNLVVDAFPKGLRSH